MENKLTKTDSLDMGFSDSDITMMMMVMMMAMMSVVMSQLVPATQAQAAALEAQSYHGIEDPRPNVVVTKSLSWLNLVTDYPYKTWISAYIINDGPSDVEIAINYPNETFIMKPRETNTINRTGARDEKIAVMFFRCTNGLRATLRITGTY